MIVRISMKLPLIGIIKNNKRGSFVLAVISLAPASINIVSHGPPIRMEQILQAFGEDRETWKQQLRKTADLPSQPYHVSTSSEDPVPGPVPKKLLDFFGSDMLQLFDFEQLLDDQMTPRDRETR